MALTPRLDLRQSQSLVMTPQLQQAIKLLQLSNLELSTFVEQELERNPLLERDDRSDDSGDRQTADDRAEDRSSADDVVLDRSDGGDDAPLDVDVDNTFNNDAAGDGGESGEAFGDWSRTGGRHDFGDGESLLEQTLARDVTLRDHLTEQIQMDLADPGDRMIAMHLMDMLNDAGWLAGDPADVADKLGCEPDRVERVLARVQRFDPSGIFARNLADCLAIQLREKDRFDPAMEALVANLDLLAKRDLAQLMRICGIDSEDLADMIGEIRALNPKPASLFDFAMAQPVTPDVLMRAGPDGDWLIELNAETLPRVLIDTRYYTQVSKAARSKDEKNYLAERYQQANWLVKSLHQRATTILKVAAELVAQQDAFFRHGIRHLRPLVLRDIATAIGMHESTVSRVTANKYMATPRGIYELKYFFTQAIANADGEAHSAESVRHRIKDLIDQEKPKEILSDDRIVEILKTDGIDIARRTVAKYREAMKIPSSVQRRREKAMGG